MALFGPLSNNYLTFYFILVKKPVSIITNKHNTYRNFKHVAVVFFISLLLYGCHSEGPASTPPSPQTTVKTIAAPVFNPDSAYAFVKAQVDFGPRIPGTPAHQVCADYLSNRLKSYGFDVIMQKATAQTYDQKKFTLKNIIASYKPELQSRVLICSHWDTRPWADEDSINPKLPFDGANDGASGVGVALEIARQIQTLPPNIGVDIIFFDLEDYGDADGESESSWCLGSQYWANNLHVPNYSANFGILLDMVGNTNAVFPKEEQSMSFASGAVNKVWKTADDIGYGSFFSPQQLSFVGSDDHVYVNKAGIPCLDIIAYDPKSGGFGDFHHSHQDNMSIIDKSTLKAVGQTLLQVIYNEK